MRLDRPFRTASGQPSLGPARLDPRLQKQAFFHRLEGRFFLSAHRDQEFLDILQIPLLHGESPVDGPVLFFREDVFKPAAVKKGRCPFKIFFRHLQKLSLCADRARCSCPAVRRGCPGHLSLAVFLRRLFPGCAVSASCGTDCIFSSKEFSLCGDLHHIGDIVFAIGRDHTKRALDSPSGGNPAGIKLPAYISCSIGCGRKLFPHTPHASLGRIYVSSRRFSRSVKDTDHTLTSGVSLCLEDQFRRLERQPRVRHMKGFALHVLFRVIISHIKNKSPFRDFRRKVFRNLFRAIPYK